MRPSRPALVVALAVPLLIAGGGARAEFSLFGSADRTPANPFASNYASPPVRATAEGPRRSRRAKPAANSAAKPAPVLRPPRDIPQ
ncbi:hypothetical protein [Methylobacterium sp. 37f]|uniref:hypothetical protein n=1 Tax=Methylobacterium sp. 37f TaxID=2817058 RepID=UPI001FFDD711|nr:hypothetical protein [Methylobacterium sp. 37f]MCK2053466.1 hypothetical protein [Methylobacterium sp. 37f]